MTDTKGTARSLSLTFEEQVINGGSSQSVNVNSDLPLTVLDALIDATDIDTADSVLHGPTGETWLVAYVEGARLAWCGWPEGDANLADCTLTKKATPEQREKLLLEMGYLSSDTSDRRRRYARQRLGFNDCPANRV